jgi:acetyl esterase/lipase
MNHRCVFPLVFALLPTLAMAEPPSRIAERERQAAEFDALDTNGDGQFAFEEMAPRSRPWMRLGDTNGDGGLDLAEYRAYLDQPGGVFDIPLPENVRLDSDIAYAGSDHHRQTLDVYRPITPASGEPLPVIAYVHGGGWSLGSKLMARPQVAPHVDSGRYAAVAIGYRLTGEASHPAQIHDTKAGIRWIRANAERFGFDPARICVMGSSAGGHLVALLGTTNGSSAHAGTLGPTPELSSDVQCSIPVFGAMDLSDRADSPSLDAFLAGDPESRVARAREASPLLQVDPTDPPHYMIHGTVDPLVAYSESVSIDAAFREAGVATALLTIEGGGHGDFFGPRITSRIRKVLDWALYGEGAPPDSETLVHPQP